MVHDETPELGPGPTRLKNVMQMLLEQIAEHLQVAARDHDGVLSAGQLRQAIESFKARTDDATLNFYRVGWNECLAVIDEVRLDSGRRMPFERLMVQPFSHLLPAPGRPPVRGQSLSRRILPGFLSAVQQMLGPVLLEQYRSRCRELVRIIQVARGSAFDWNEVHADPTSQVIVNDVLVHISRHFADLPRRRAWMIGLIESGMPMADDDGERRWSFGEAEFRLLMEALFRPLREQMANIECRRRMHERYGDAACRTLAAVLAELEDGSESVTPLRRAAP